MFVRRRHVLSYLDTLSTDSVLLAETIEFCRRDNFAGETHREVHAPLLDSQTSPYLVGVIVQQKVYMLRLEDSLRFPISDKSTKRCHYIGSLTFASRRLHAALLGTSSARNWA